MRPILPFGVRTCAALLLGSLLAAAGRAAAAAASRALALAQVRAATLRMSADLEHAADLGWESRCSHSSNSTSGVDLFGEVSPRFPRPGTPSSISSLDDEPAPADPGIEAPPPGGGDDTDEPQIVFRVSADALGAAPASSEGEPSRQPRHS